MRFNISITIISFILFAADIITNSTSNYEGVLWDKQRKLWKAEFYFDGKTSKSYFKNELDAAKRINQLCENMEIPLKNSDLQKISNRKTKQQTSQYKGVSWQKETGLWRVQISANGQTYGGRFKEELDAAKRVNQLCVEMDIPLQNPKIGCAIPTQQYQKRQKTSQYKGVYWHKETGNWYAYVNLKGGKRKFCGCFKIELDAAKAVNQLCKEMKVPPQNPGIRGIPIQQYRYVKEKTSQYTGVSWDKSSTKHWRAQVCSNGQIYGGRFKKEIDAATRVNQLCAEMNIPLQNPGISAIPTQPNQDDRNQTIAKSVNPMNASEILSKTDGINEKKRKCKKSDENYFYEHFLK